MIYNEIKNIFRIYDAIEKQDQYFKSADKVFSYNFLSPADSVLPFQFVVPLQAGEVTANITAWHLKYENGSSADPYNFVSLISSLEKKVTITGEVYITYKATAPMMLPGATLLDLQKGRYYMELTVDGIDYWSEVFAVCEKFSITDTYIPYLKFEFDNVGEDGPGDLGDIMYQTGFKNLLYLDINILTEEPSVEEEGHENGAKEFTPDLSRLVENFRIDDIMPFFLAEAIMVMSIHKNVVMTLPNNIYAGKIRNMKASMKQEAVSNAYRLELSFSQDSRYINTSCSTLIDIFNGPTGVILSASGVSRGNVLGNVDFTFTVSGNATKVVIRDIDHGAPLCSLNDPAIFPVSVNEGTKAGYANTTHTMEVVPVTTFNGEDYDGEPYVISVPVAGSGACN